MVTMRSSTARAELARSARLWWPWAIGALTGAAVLGPALAPGSLFNLDLAVSNQVEVPESLWGLGPELPRRGPFYVFIAAGSWLGAGAGAWKALAVAAVASAFAGIVRRTADLPVLLRVGSGWVYALSPFLLTRLGVGHLGLVLAMALLPHALPALARPATDLRRTFLWSVGLSLCGVYGLLLSVPLLAGGLVGQPLGRWFRVAATVLVGHLWWLVSSVFVLAQGTSVAPGSAFPPSSFGEGAYLRVLAGQGFWQPAYQVGITQGWLVPLAGLVLTGLALHGHRLLPDEQRRPLAVGAMIGIAVTLAPVVPGLDSLHDALTTTPLGGPIRESQRLLVLWVLWLALSSARSIDALSRRWSEVPFAPLWAIPGALALMLGAPGLWAVGGQLEPIELPAGWRAVQDEVADRPGTVLALPWTEFFDLPIAENRRVVHPVPFVVRGDVLVSADPQLDDGTGSPFSETVDPRVAAMESVIAELRAGRPVATDLARRGVRWVVLVEGADSDSYVGLDRDLDLERVVAEPSVTLYENRRWIADVQRPDVDGSATDPGWDVRQPIPGVPILSTTDPDATGRWARAGGRWWMQGLQPVETGPLGTARLPGGSGVLWYWPGVVVLIVDLVVLGLVLAMIAHIGGVGRVGGRRRIGKSRKVGETGT